MTPPPSPLPETASAAPLPLSPYPGLRPFRPEESRLFCGRSQNRIELLTRLEHTRFLAVIGASGSGKSSLVMAGLLPDIAEGLLLTIEPGTQRVVYFKPGRNPFRSLAEGLARTFRAGAPGEEAEIERLLRHSSAQGFRKVLDRFLPAAGMEPGEQPPSIIVVADQFEEIFRFASLEKSEVDSAEFLEKRGGVPVLDTVQNEAQAFVDLLLHAYTLPDRAVCIVLTMRSDFLHRCEAFDRLPGVISAHQYLTPRLQRTQLADAIAIPATHFGAALQPELVNLILNELSPEQDQLPVLEHALARLWQHAQAKRNPSNELGIEDYRAIGGIQDALSLHGKEILAGVKSASGGALGDEAVGRFFRCLAEWDPAGALIRRPRTVAQIAAESGLSMAHVKLIADHFRGANNHWLTPMLVEVETLDEERILDLTHESLLRKWDRFSDKTGWMAKEKEQRDHFLRLRERLNETPATPPSLARVFSMLRLNAQIWKPAGLTPAQVQRFRETFLKGPEPTEAWARRYEGSWTEAKGFLNAAMVRQSTIRVGLVLFIALFVCSGIYSLWTSAEIARSKATAAAAELMVSDAKADAAKMARDKSEVERKFAVKERELAQARADKEEREADEARTKLEQEKREQEVKEKSVRSLTLNSPSDRDLVQTVRDSLVTQMEDSRRALEQARLTESELREIAVAAKSYLAAPGRKGESKELEALRQALGKQGYNPAQQVALPAEAPSFLPGPVKFMEHRQPVVSAAFVLVKDKLHAVTSSKEPSVKLWTLDGKTVNEILTRNATSLVPTGDGRLIIVGEDVFLRVWSPDMALAEHFLPNRAKKDENIVNGRALPDNRLLFWTTAGRIGLWPAPGQRPIMFSARLSGAADAVDFFAGKNWLLASADDGSATRWKLDGINLRLLDTFKAEAPVRGATFDSRGEFALLPCSEKKITLIRLFDSTLGRSKSPPGDLFRLVAEKSDQEKPLRKAKLFDLEHTNPVVAGSFSPNGDSLATRDTRGLIYLWQITAAARRGAAAALPPPVVLSDHRQPVTAMQWSPDGRYLASADESGMVLLWQWPRSRAENAFSSLPLVFPSHKGSVTALTIAPRGDFLLSGGVDSAARILPLRPTIAGPGRVTFGGPDDNSGGATEGLALFNQEDVSTPDYKDLFSGMTKMPGLARRLNPEQLYFAARWDYTITSRTFLRKNKVLVRNPHTGDSVLAQAVDWGPSPSTGAVADLSPGLAKHLGLAANDPVEVIVDLIPAEPAKNAEKAAVE